METSDLYKSKTDCCGCEACSQVCPQGLIVMEPDAEGFLYPKIASDERCINCGRCINVCPAKAPGRQQSTYIQSYGGHILNDELVAKSASGGFAYSLYCEFMNDGGVVYGVRYSDDFLHVLYSKAEHKKNLNAFRGSKYVQANKGKIFKQIVLDLKEGQRVLFVGLPCEISALYHFVGKHTENLYTVSLICHGPTSEKVHQLFCKEKFGSENIQDFSVRYKYKGWKPYYIRAIYGNNNQYLQKFIDTPYEAAFKYLKRPSCSVCRYKFGDKEYGVTADLVLGDYHGVHNTDKAYNRWGVSQASSFTEKGNYLCDLIKRNSIINAIPLSVIISSNEAMVRAVPSRRLRPIFSKVMIKRGLFGAAHHPLIRLDMGYRIAKKKIRDYIFRTGSMVLKSTKKFFIKNEGI